MFGAEHTIVAALLQGADEARPVNLAEAGHAVAPPAIVEDRYAAVFIAQDLGVLGVGVQDMRAIQACDGVGVDAEPVEVRGVKVEAKGGDSREERAPLLGGIKEIARWALPIKSTMAEQLSASFKQSE